MRVSISEQIRNLAGAAYIAATAHPFSRFDAANLAVLAGDYARHAASLALHLHPELREDTCEN